MSFGDQVYIAGLRLRTSYQQIKNYCRVCTVLPNTGWGYHPSPKRSIVVPTDSQLLTVKDEIYSHCLSPVDPDEEGSPPTLG